MATPYLWYTNFENSTTITNKGSGGSTYNGQAARNDYGTNSVGHPTWGPIKGNTDGIQVPGGISNPYNHTWEIGLNINQWWPVNGVVDGILCGNDGKLWSAGNNMFYGYIHEECSYPPLVQLGTHYLTLEIQGGCTELDVQFWLGVGNSKPTKMTPDPIGTDDGPGVLYQQFGGYNLQLNTNYYFQISVTANGPAMPNYCIGNCTFGGSTCADATVTGFPCGCYIYCWREYNSAIDLSGGGDWAADVPIWAGGTPPGPGPGPTPTPVATAPNVNLNASVREYQPGSD